MSDFSIQQILQGDSAQLTRLLAAAGLERTYLAVRVFASITAGDSLDASLQALLIQSREPHLKILADESFYTHSDHKHRQLFNCLLKRAATWYPRDTKSSQQFLEKAQALIRASTESPDISQTLAEFEQWLDTEDKRAALVESRLCEAELNHLKHLAAETRVLDLINGALAHKPFPVQLHDRLPAFKSELLHCVFTGGNASPFWKTWERLLPLLGTMFGSDEVDEQTLYRQIPALLNELERSLKLNTGNPDFYQHWISELSDCLVAAVKKQPVDCAPLAPLEYPENQINTRVTQAVLQQGNNLQTGDWILFSGEDNATVRCKLALKNDENDQLLFVDNTGRKVMIKSAKDFSLCLSTGIAKPLHFLDLDQLITHELQALVTKADAREDERRAEEEAFKAKAQVVAELEQKLEQQKQAKAKAQQQRQLAAENAARQAAARKALEEARALAEEKARRQAQQQLEEELERERRAAAETAEHLQRVQMANIQIAALNLGARVELLQKDEWVRGKLAVIIAATGKYIFVDNLGRKIAELQRDQLLSLLIEKQLVLFTNGDSFDDQLAKVIRGLRKDVT